MGGNALKNTTTRRLDRPAFERVSALVVQGLEAAFPGARVRVIPAYAAKADFGDLDLLVTQEDLEAHGGAQALARLATQRFHATDQYKNGNVLSFDFRDSADTVEPGFQVDMISMPRESFDFALNYFSFNDLGNLIGRTAHKQGASFGHDGLWYYFRDGDYKFREVLLTRDFDRALRYLGYEPARFRQGFETLEDIFQYVAGSEFFNPAIFLLENRNYQSRVRDRKRKTYTEFLAWCEARPELPAYPYLQDKAEWLPRMFEWFPNFKRAYDQAEEDLTRQRAVKARFNGEIVSRWSGLADKQLGMLMKHVKAEFESARALEDYVLQASEQELMQRVMGVKQRLQL